MEKSVTTKRTSDLASNSSSLSAAQRARKRIKINIQRNWDMYLLILPLLIYFIIFRYAPMYGVQIAFRKFRAADGIMGSQWIGFENFIRFFNNYQFKQTIGNTLTLSAMSLLLGFLPPIFLALLLNQMGNQKFRKSVQTISYVPHFISTVVMVSILFVFLSPSSGPFNKILGLIGMDARNFMGSPNLFPWVYVISGIWQTAGYSAIIYIASLASVSPEFYEAAMVDGASKFQRLIHIDIPFLIPMITTMFILNAGRIMSIGYEKVFLMQTPLNLKASEIISTYVYKVGLINSDFSYSTAISLFNNLINLVLIFTVNGLTKKLSSENALW